MKKTPVQDAVALLTFIGGSVAAYLCLKKARQLSKEL